MKKILICLLAVILLLAVFTFTALATDNGEDDRIDAIDAAIVNSGPAENAVVTTTTYGEPAAETVSDPEPVTPGEPLTWAYLATIAGAAAATLLVVQFAKIQLDKVWKIPTRLFVYIVALIFMLLGTAFTTGLTVNTGLLTAVNALVAAITAYGAYEITFAKKDAEKKATA